MTSGASAPKDAPVHISAEKLPRGPQPGCPSPETSASSQYGLQHPHTVELKPQNGKTGVNAAQRSLEKGD